MDTKAVLITNLEGALNDLTIKHQTELEELKQKLTQLQNEMSQN